MAKIKLISNQNVQVNGSSGSIGIVFGTTEKLQTITFLTDNGVKDETANTCVYLYDTKEGVEYPYTYKLYYTYGPNNASAGKIKLITWVLNVNFINDSLTLNGNITQTYNSRASYITNIGLYLEDALMEKDMYGRWIIPYSFREGTKFYIKYDCSYPPIPSQLPNTNVNETIGTSFLENVYTQNQGVSVVEISELQGGTYIEDIQLDYDDNWGVGASITHVVLTRASVKPVSINVNPEKILNVSPSGGNMKVNYTLNNILRENLHIDYDPNMLDASFDSSTQISISIGRNIGETAVPRSSVVLIYGTNSDGVYGEASIMISQTAMGIPYIGDAIETIEDYTGEIIPAIRTDYKGNVINGTGVFTLYNALDSEGEPVFDNMIALLNEKPTDFIDFSMIPSTRNMLIKAKDMFKYNYESTDIRSTIEIFIDLSTGEEIRYPIAIISEASPEHIVSPIWKDVFYECPKNYFRFKSLKTGELLYNGMIYPDAENKIKINSILSSYIELNKYPFEKDINLNRGMIEAILEISDTPTFEHYEEAKIYHLYWNYSYNYNAQNTMMSGYTIGYYGWHSGIDIDVNFYNPIEYYDPRQYVFISYELPYYSYNGVDSQVYGVKEKEGISEELIRVEKGTIKGDIATIAVRPGDYDELIFHIDKYEGEDEDKDYVWKVGHYKCTKAKYAVYYLNSYGLWCWMLFEGKQMETIKTTVNKYLNNDTNAISYNIHNAVYQNNLEETYNLTSMYLKDEQSEKLKDLYTSPLIFVHELETDNIYNVYLNNTTYDIKNFNNQGRKYFTHNIKLVKSINKSIII